MAKSIILSALYYRLKGVVNEDVSFCMNTQRRVSRIMDCYGAYHVTHVCRRSISVTCKAPTLGINLLYLFDPDRDVINRVKMLVYVVAS